MSENDKILDNIQTRISIKNNPFPFFFINNFLPLNIVKKAEDEFVKFSDLKDAGNERYQKTKLVFNKYEEMPPTIKDIVKIFYSKNFLKVLENKFNLKNLEPDWTLQGGGMHQSFNGGFLKVLELPIN